jgi:hypothetical protein
MYVQYRRKMEADAPAYLAQHLLQLAASADALLLLVTQQVLAVSCYTLCWCAGVLCML